MHCKLKLEILDFTIQKFSLVIFVEQRAENLAEKMEVANLQEDYNFDVLMD